MGTYLRSGLQAVVPLWDCAWRAHLLGLPHKLLPERLGVDPDLLCTLVGNLGLPCTHGW